ncbi:uncharacterized protein LOC106180016 [Lingula anatina]|uniref:adenine phosphoribosyltransferase n=1 Tax=Lingula anatina TaxID=7574 RepID=A0A1S3KA55_LINAN|nr:uncharacterized protein LOC106180016 [Lingula anatina]|eukprot:XP_013419334.1 uncharacterized protein LOC106180016 [Lingula anatina]
MSGKDKQPGWYLSLAMPNVRGPAYAWLDPSPIYLNPEAMQDCVADMIRPFDHSEIDLVAGIDGTGFVLGSAIAYHLKKGFLMIRKAGHLAVDVTTVEYTDYQKKQKSLEMRQNPFPPGTRVLVVDQWIETGGTMWAAVNLIEKAGGKVAGIATICMEEMEGAMKLKMQYDVVHCVPNEELQKQVNDHYLESFKNFEK